MTLSPPYRDTDWEDGLEQHPKATTQIHEGILFAVNYIKSCADQKRLFSIPLVCSTHEYIFKDTFPEFAGIMRSRLMLNVTFGANGAVHHELIESELQQLLNYVNRCLPYFDDYPGIGDREFLKHIFRLAAHFHIHFIRIHPFRNGNGRLCRILFHLILHRYELSSIPIIISKSEKYIEELNLCMKRGCENDAVNRLGNFFMKMAYNTM